MEISCKSRGQRGLADIEGHAGMKVADAVSLAVLKNVVEISSEEE